MEILNAKEIKNNIDDLTKLQRYPALSIYLNTHPRWTNNEKAKIKLKNVVEEIEEKLKNKDINVSKIKDLLKPFDRLDKKEAIWKNTSEGLALFISEDYSIGFNLPHRIKTRHYIGNYFNVKRIARYVFERENYYVLAISKKENYFYEGENRHTKLLEAVSSDMPDSLEDATVFKEGEKYTQFHKTKPTAGPDAGGPTFHGHGAYKDGEEIYLRRYLEMVDNVVTDALADKKDPLVLICSDSIYTTYKEVNNYPHLLKNYVEGNPDTKRSRTKLLKKSWKVVKKELKNQKKEIKKSYEESYDRKLSDLTNIVRSAYYGNTAKLLLGTLKDVWGTYDMVGGNIKKQDRTKKDSEDLVNLAVLYTIKNDGEVYKVDDSIFSGRYNIGAISRY